MPALAFDFEAYAFSPGNQLTRTVCMSYNEIDDSLRVVDRNVVLASAGIQMLVEAIKAGYLMVGANTAYDVLLSVFNAPDPEAMLALWVQAYNSDRVTDVLRRQTLEDFAFDRQRHRYSLETVNDACETGLLLDKNSQWRTNFHLLDGVPIAQYPLDALQYSMSDADATGLCLIRQEQVRRKGSPWFPGRDIQLDQFRQARKALALKDISNVGLHTNPVTVYRLETHVKSRQAELLQLLLANKLAQPKGDTFSRDTKQAQLIRYADRSADKKHTAACKCCLCANNCHCQSYFTEPSTYGCKCSVCKKGGKCRQGHGTSCPCCVCTGKAETPKFSLDGDSCEKSKHPLLMAYSEYTKNQKQLSTDIALLKRAATQPFHANYRPLQSTGRTSTGSDGENDDTKGNVQNNPRTPGVRECYVAPPGFKLVETDMPSAELCSFGQLSIWIGGWSQVATDINAGDDPLMRIGCHMLHTTYEDAIARKKAKDFEAIEKRTCAKAVCYGRKGMMGPDTLVGYAWNNYKVVTTRDEAAQWIEYHDRACPEMNAIYSPWCKSHARNPGRRDTVYDFVHPWSGRCRAGLFYNDIHNYPFQGLISDVAGVALWNLFCAQHGFSELGKADPYYGCMTAHFGHDSFSAYAPEERAAAAAHRLGEIVTKAMRQLMPDLIVKAEGQIMNQMSKQAEPKYADKEKTQLIPWDVWDATREDALDYFKKVDKGDLAPHEDGLPGYLKKRKWPPYCIEDIGRELATEDSLRRVPF